MGKDKVSSNDQSTSKTADFVTNSTSASKMLEAALLQMDDIISGTDNDVERWQDSLNNSMKNLITAIQTSSSLPPPPDEKTTDLLLAWLQPEKIKKMEIERNALHLEISMLLEQLDEQSSRIQDLENELQFKKDSLRQTEEALQKEMILRSGLETQKLELINSLSEMKLKQAELERENANLRSNLSTKSVERFSRYGGQYNSLPRSAISKRAVAFADKEKIIIDRPFDANMHIRKPFADMSTEEVCTWITQLGLGSYVNEMKRWKATGKTLLEASLTQLEKEIEIKNVLHKKKFICAIEFEKSQGAGYFGSDKMNTAAVLRWLDDIGLPQHKEAFQGAKIDGRVLNKLTTDDLSILNITAQLHAASLRRGIQVLRELNFEYDYLERRSSSENNSRCCNDFIKIYGQVVLWTNHRVMDWLREVDLAEYAPNMRGSGVHGGLIMLEPRFTSELLATLLNISPSKTLLRRHLTTRFNELIGRDAVKKKREIENSIAFQPLTITAKLKISKKSQFTLKRKKGKNEMDYSQLVCPLEPTPPGSPMMNSTCDEV